MLPVVFIKHTDVLLEILIKNMMSSYLIGLVQIFDVDDKRTIDPASTVLVFCTIANIEAFAGFQYELSLIYLLEPQLPHLV